MTCVKKITEWRESADLENAWELDIFFFRKQILFLQRNHQNIDETISFLNIVMD